MMVGCRAAAPLGQAHHPVRRRDPPLQQGAAGRLPALRRARRHHPDRRDHREPVVRSHLGAPFPLAGVRAARPHCPRDHDAAAAGAAGARRRATDELLEQIAIYANGDARQAYNTLEAAAAAARGRATHRGWRAGRDAAQGPALRQGRRGALQPDLRAPQVGAVERRGRRAVLAGPHAGAGEDRMYIARRIVRMSIEDIGLADPRAMEQASRRRRRSTSSASPRAISRWHRPSSTCASRRSPTRRTRRSDAVQADVQKTIAEPVPMHLRNAPTRA